MQTMTRHIWAWLRQMGGWVVLCPVTAIVSPSFGQTTPTAVWEPVDQTVADLDLRATSLRRVEPGLSVYGQTGSLYHRSNIGLIQPGYDGRGAVLNQTYQLRQPGFTAWLDRPDYLVYDPLGELRLNVSPGQDRRFLDVIPPNTVFDLVPDTTTPLLPTVWPPDTQYGVDHQVNTRLGGAIPAMTHTVSVTPTLPPPPRAHRLPDHLIEQRKARLEQLRKQDDPSVDSSESIPPEDEHSDKPAPDHAESSEQ